MYKEGRGRTVGRGRGVGLSLGIAKRNVQLNSDTGPGPQLKAPAGICMVLTPGTAGDVLKMNSIVVSPFTKVTLSAVVPFTVKSLASRVAGSTGSVTLTVKSVGGTKTTLSEPALVTEHEAGVGIDVPPTDGTLPKKASCCETPLIVTRPSVHEVRCLPAIAEP